MVRRKTRVRHGETQQWIETKDPKLREAWEFRKRSGGVHKSTLGPGGSEAAKAGARKVRAYTLECRRCGSLVDWTAAKKRCRERVKRLERKQESVDRSVARTDGCASNMCTKMYRHSRYVKAQRRYADMLESGERILVEWPEDVDDTEIWQRPDEERDGVVRAIREKYGE